MQRTRARNGARRDRNYVAAFPDSVDHRREIRCRHCGSTSIQVQWVAFNQGSNVHTCRHCGTPLYRS